MAPCSSLKLAREPRPLDWSAVETASRVPTGTCCGCPTRGTQLERAQPVSTGVRSTSSATISKAIWVMSRAVNRSTFPSTRRSSVLATGRPCGRGSRALLLAACLLGLVPGPRLRVGPDEGSRGGQRRGALDVAGHPEASEGGAGERGRPLLRQPIPTTEREPVEGELLQDREGALVGERRPEEAGHGDQETASRKKAPSSLEMSFWSKAISISTQSLCALSSRSLKMRKPWGAAPRKPVQLKV